MKLFIVAVPIFSSGMGVEYYMLKFQSGTRLFGTSSNYASLDGAMNSPGIELLNEIGLEPFTGRRKILVPVNQFLLLANFAEKNQAPPDMVICMLSSDIPLTDLYLDKCRELQQEGYKLALDNFEYNAETAPIFDLADFIIIDTTVKNYKESYNLIRSHKSKTKVIFTNIADKWVFHDLRLTPNALFEGRFYNQPITKGVHKIAPLKMNTVELLKILGEEDFHLDYISEIIQRDAALSISLLRFINSPAIGLSGKISSISHAVAMLGQKETKKWITAAASTYLAVDKPDEISKISLTRAKFAENLAPVFRMDADAAGLFLVGLFSLLDIILELPMDKAAREISLDLRIREALVDKRGPLFEVMSLIYAYEQADWKTVSYIMILNEISVEDIYQAFINSLVWYRELLRSTD